MVPGICSAKNERVRKVRFVDDDGLGDVKREKADLAEDHEVPKSENGEERADGDEVVAECCEEREGRGREGREISGKISANQDRSSKKRREASMYVPTSVTDSLHMKRRNKASVERRRRRRLSSGSSSSELRRKEESNSLAKHRTPPGT